MERDNLSTFSPGEQLAWLRQVAHNKLANTYRHAQRHPQVPLDSIEEIYVETEGPEQLVLRQEEHSQLRIHLQRLPALQQRVLQSRYGNGLSHAEIAILLHKREGAVRQMLSRTIHFLRRIYQQTEGESTLSDDRWRKDVAEACYTPQSQLNSSQEKPIKLFDWLLLG